MGYKIRFSFSLYLLLILGLFGCGGGGGGGSGDRNDGSNQDEVLLAGQVGHGTPRTPIVSATCRFVGRNRIQYAIASANTSGMFELEVPSGRQGFVQCAPRNFPNLILSTFVSTEGRDPGDRIPIAIADFEETSPTTTVLAQTIIQENPVDGERRKNELSALLAAGDPDLTAMVEAAELMYPVLLEARANVVFGDDQGETGEDGADSDSDGAEGSADDGAGTSPLSEAACDFALSLDGPTFTRTVLSDFLADGIVDRPDLQIVADTINGRCDESCRTRMRNAFARRFPSDIGRPLTTIATDAASATPGRFFLPIPPGVQGFIRCSPPNQSQLMLATFIRPLEVNERLTGQDVMPQTALFSSIVASILEKDLPLLKQNYLADISGLRVEIVRTNGRVTGFRVVEPNRVADANVGLSAFSTTALFNALFQNSFDADFPATLRDLAAQSTVTPTSLMSAGVPAAQAEALAGVVNDSTAAAEANLGANLDTAFATAKLSVKVTEAASGVILPGAMVDMPNLDGNVRCDRCPVTTNAAGEAVITLLDVPRDISLPLELTITSTGFINTTVVTSLVGVATVNVDVALRMDLTDVELVDLGVTPQSPTIALSTSQQFSALGNFTDGTTVDLTGEAMWSSSDPNIATISSDGRALGVAAGTATITATFGAFIASTVLTVTAVPLPIDMGPELSVPCSEGAEPLLLSYGSHTVNCAINPATDSDDFRFIGSSGDSVRVIVRKATEGFDPRLQVRDPGGVRIVDRTCGGGGAACSFSTDLSLTQAGTYSLTILGNDSGVSGDYQVQLERIFPPLASAAIPYNVMVTDTINPPTDTDFFTFEGAAATSISLTVSGQTGGLDPRLQLRDPDGVKIADRNCGGGNTICSFSVDLSLTLSGTYSVAIFDDGFNENGDYAINLQCRAGTCPTN